ncbi:MAG: RNA methyltransferase [Pseudomonadota bacterium]
MTNSAQPPINAAPPAIVLVEPQLGENIGSAARVMLNFGLVDLRLVAPRDGWPNPAAETLSAGAFDAGVGVSQFDQLSDAIADRKMVFATTARPRGMQKPIFAPHQATERIRSSGQATAILFGGEKSGLSNDDIAFADGILTYAVNPSFSSLNLAQAVGVFASTWAAKSDLPLSFSEPLDPPAPRIDVIRMLEHFEKELDRAGFFFPPEKTSLMQNNLRNALIRANWTEQEVRTFRGAIKALAIGRGAARIDRDQS